MRLPVLLAACVMGASAFAEPMVVSLKSPADLQQFGFRRGDTSSPEGSHFENGLLRIDQSVNEWMLWPGTGPWWDWVDFEKGWAVEATLEVVPVTPKCRDTGAGMWIHDKRRMVRVEINHGSLKVAYPLSKTVEIANTEGFHTYRVEARGWRVRILMDGKVVLDADDPQTLQGGASQVLMFGGLGGANCSPVPNTVWKAFSYDWAPKPRPLATERWDLLRPDVPNVNTVLDKVNGALTPEAAKKIGRVALKPAQGQCLAYAVVDVAVRRAAPRLGQSTALAELPELRSPAEASRVSGVSLNGQVGSLVLAAVNALTKQPPDALAAIDAGLKLLAQAKSRDEYARTADALANRILEIANTGATDCY